MVFTFIVRGSHSKLENVSGLSAAIRQLSIWSNGFQKSVCAFHGFVICPMYMEWGHIYLVCPSNTVPWFRLTCMQTCMHVFYKTYGCVFFVRADGWNESSHERHPLSCGCSPSLKTYSLCFQCLSFFRMVKAFVLFVVIVFV